VIPYGKSHPVVLGWISIKNFNTHRQDMLTDNKGRLQFSTVRANKISHKNSRMVDEKIANDYYLS